MEPTPIDAASLKARIESALPGVAITVLTNESSSGQHSLLVPAEHMVAVATFLRDDPRLLFDYASNVTGVDWPELSTTEKRKVPKTVDGVTTEVEETITTVRPAYLEAVYHLYSIGRRHGPVVLRARTGNRTDQVQLPSLTPVWRSCEFQEREIYDLFGIVFTGHPDLRRILMWDGYKDHPMRKDYVEPDDYEYEPTPHDEVIAKAKAHYPAR